MSPDKTLANHTITHRVKQVLAHLSSSHGKGVAEELDRRLSVPNWIRMDLGFFRLVGEHWVSLGNEESRIDHT